MDYHKLRYATRLLRRDAEERKVQAAALHERAATLVQAGKLDEAEAHYERLLAQVGDNADWWHELALLHSNQGRPQHAATALLRAIRLDASAAELHYDFGTQLGQLDDQQAALREYLAAIGAETPTSGDLLEGAASAARGQTLGHLLMARHRIHQAVEAYESVWHLRPDDPSLTRSLAAALRCAGDEGRAALLSGHAFYLDGRHSRAISEITRGLALVRGDTASYVELGHALLSEGRYADAIDICNAGIALYPLAADLFQTLVEARLKTNRPDEAARVVQAAQEALSNPQFMSTERYLSLPVVYEDEAEIGAWRRRFGEGLRALTQETNVDDADALRQARANIRPSFFLGYQAQNDLALQREHGDLIHRIMRASFPDWARARPMPRLDSGDRIRVGYVLAGNDGIDPLFLGWLSGHDRKQFEIVTYQIGGTVAPSTRHFKAASDRYCYLPSELDEVCEHILEDRLHVLVFLYVGMSPLVSQLASLRLAPIQCAAWGHPMTTGLPTIDYFISSEMMEPEDADTHYSEALVRLPGIGIVVQRPFLPPLSTTRAEFNLPEEAVVYLSPQAPAKYLPQYDHVFADIAGRVPHALFVLFDLRGPEVMRTLRRRLDRAFAHAGLDRDRFIRFLPRQRYDKYIELIRQSDVFLDTFGWSGGLTTLDAVRCALPVVTCPGRFMRGRQSLGILRHMGVTDTVATSVDNYIEIAVRLGRDQAWRQQLSRQLTERQDRLCEDWTSVSALEDFYTRIVRAHDGLHPAPR